MLLWIESEYKAKTCYDAGMKWPNIILLLVTVYVPIAWPQVRSGTVIYLYAGRDEVTVAADSRASAFDPSGQPTGHTDSECKISMFGSQFVFVHAGIVGSDATKWNPHSVALQAWKEQSATHRTAEALVHAVAKSWTTTMEGLLNDQNIISIQRRRMGIGSDPVLATALFAGTDSSGGMAVRAVEITFDLNLFDSTNVIRLMHDGFDPSAGDHVVGGHSEIVNEFIAKSSPRAAEYMAWYDQRISALSASEQQAELASKYIELSLLLNEHRDELGFPIDVVQLRRKSGVFRRWLKPNCRAFRVTPRQGQKR